MTRAFPFTFERSKLVPKPDFSKEDVLIDATRFARVPPIEVIQSALHNGLPVTCSGRTLSDVLPISCPDQLASYSIDTVQDVWGKTKVTYSKREPSMADMMNSLNELRAEVASLRSGLQSQESTMLRWQTANLVFHAFGAFAWGQLADETKAQLVQHGIKDFSSLFYSKSSKKDAPAERAAKTAYRTLDSDLRQWALVIIGCKQAVADNRAKVAHPPVSQPYLEEYLDSLTNTHSDPSPLDIQLFEYLRTSSLSTDNVEN